MATPGPRGTDSLLYEQRPINTRKRKRKGRVQPYRDLGDMLAALGGRPLGTTLDNMTKGASSLGNPADFQRAAQRAAANARGGGSGTRAARTGTYVGGSTVNKTQNERAGLRFRTFKRDGDTFHEYMING